MTHDVADNRLAARPSDKLQKPSIDIVAETSERQQQMHLKLGLKPLDESDKTQLLFDKINFYHEVHININEIECTYIPFDENKAIADGDIADYKVRKTCRFYIQKDRRYKKLHKYSVFDGYANPTYKGYLSLLFHYQY